VSAFICLDFLVLVIASMLFLLVVGLFHAFWSRVASRKEKKARRERSGPESKNGAASAQGYRALPRFFDGAGTVGLK
jgi:hypothetical protein